MNDFVNLLAIFVSSIITSMGLGGGSFYILYLTFFTDTEQFTAQGYNLLLFSSMRCYICDSLCWKENYQL